MHESLGTVLENLREQAHFSKTDLGNKIGSAAHQITRYENGKQTPSIEKIDQICQALDLKYETRVYLYQLRDTKGIQEDYTNVTSIPDKREVNLCLNELYTLLEQSDIPILIVDYKNIIYKANLTAISFMGISRAEADQMIEEKISLFDIVFDSNLGIRNTLEDFNDVAIDLIRDFISFNVLHKNDAFYKKYPQICASIYPEFEDLWNKASEDDPYIELVLSRSLGLAHKTIDISDKDNNKFKFYISRHNIPTLANLYRIFRFVPHDDKTRLYFTNTFST